MKIAVFWATIIGLMAGCGGNPHKPDQAQKQFAAGQEAAFTMLQQNGIFVVRMAGPFDHPVLRWREGMTLAEAVLQAGYLAQTDPAQIIIQRGPTPLTIDPRQLLEGEDVPIESGDVIHVLP